MTTITAAQRRAARQATQLGVAVEEFGDLLTAEERDMAGRLIFALDEIAEGHR